MYTPVYGTNVTIMDYLGIKKHADTHIKRACSIHFFSTPDSQTNITTRDYFGMKTYIFRGGMFHGGFHSFFKHSCALYNRYNYELFHDENIPKHYYFMNI